MPPCFTHRVRRIPRDTLPSLPRLSEGFFEVDTRTVERFVLGGLPLFFDHNSQVGFAPEGDLSHLEKTASIFSITL